MGGVNASPEVVERERRQLDLMMERIASYRHGEIGIARAIGDLEALLGQLQLIDETWRDRFVGAWSALEIAYAVALDGLLALPDASDEAIGQGLDTLEELVKTALAAL